MRRRWFMTRRSFLAAGAGGAFAAAGLERHLGTAPTETSSRGATIHESHHGGTHEVGTVGRVDHERNGFNPTNILIDFDSGTLSRDAEGRLTHEYEIKAYDKPIEVAPGIVFPAWTYNGRIPGPTIRVTEGDRVRITFTNASARNHTMHFHGIHPAAMDGVPGAGEVLPGDTFVYDFIAEPFGVHLYHCHSLPLAQHIHRGLYGAFIVDPKGGRPEANEMVMVMNAFDTDFDGENEIYAVNTIPFHYVHEPIRICAGQLQRAYVINITEFDPLNSIHLHATFFNLYRTGTSLQPHEFTDTISMGQAERHILEFTYREPGRFMFHAHQTEFVDLGWMSIFEVQ